MMDFDTMEAGPELDRLIAEKVMGWGFHKYKSEDPDHVGYFTYEIPDHPFQKFQKFDWRDLPLFSKDISAAWKILEKLETFRVYGHAADGSRLLQQYAYNIYHQRSGRDWPDYTVQVYQPFNSSFLGLPYIDVKGSADTLPLAICRAALKAVEARTDAGKDAGMEENR